jgi:hypothetical protein
MLTKCIVGVLDDRKRHCVGAETFWLLSDLIANAF